MAEAEDLLREALNKLTKEEIIHLVVDAGVTTIQGLERTFNSQACQRTKYQNIEPCWECKAIATRLGYPV